MIMKYEQGRSYDFEVKQIEQDRNGKSYFAVTDGENEYRVYGILPSQYEDCPDEVTAYVKQVDVTGRILLSQDIGVFCRNHYRRGEIKTFRVNEVAEDFKKHGLYYKISDELMEHRYYFSGEQRHEVGEDIELKIDDFEERGFLRFAEIDEDRNASVTTPSRRQVYVPDNQPGVLEGIEGESTTLELKTSIVFSPESNGQPDVAKQCKNILKVLAAFMNAEGGDLYIGVHDKTHVVTGIEKDYPHLGEDPDDRFSYNSNRDGFELKIRNLLDDHCQGVANELVDFDFKSLGNHDYCIIHVQKASRPIWIDGTRLYQRVGNRNHQLKGDDINHYVVKRMANPIIEQQVGTAQPLDAEMFMQMFRKVLNEHKPVVTSQGDKAMPDEPPKEWYVWQNNGRCMRFSNTEYKKQKDGLTDVFFAMPVYSFDELIVLCYASGFINVVTREAMKNALNSKKIIEEGFNTSDGIKPLRIFLARKDALLAGFSVDEHGKEYVKLHSLTDFSEKKHPKNQGVRFIPTSGRITEFKILPATKFDDVPHLVCKKAETSQKFGTPMDSMAYHDEVEFVASFI